MSKNNFSLQPGDTVDVIAPASGCHPEVIEKFKTFLTGWELKYHIPEDIFGSDLLCANSDEKRFNQLSAALSNSHSKAVWCLLGGYGSPRLLPLLEKLKPIAQHKLFIGFSDITALHIFLQMKWGWQTIHGPSGRQAALSQVSASSLNSLKKMLFSEKNTLTYALQPLNKLAENDSTITTSIIGGNLSLIQTSIGTRWQINPTDKILFIEETSERAYKVDRMLGHLKQAGILDQAKAIILGDFTGGAEPGGGNFVADTLKIFAEHCNIPVLHLAGAGHGESNYPISFGPPVALQMGNHSSLEWI